MRRHLAAVAAIAAALAITTGCSDNESSTPPSTSSSPATTTSTTAPSPVPTTTQAQVVVPPAPNTVAPTVAPTVTRTVTQAPTTTDPYSVPCTGGPNEGSICTNPNHGGGPTATKPAARDDDPGGSPCTTGMGDPGTYTWSESSKMWVCQIS